ITRDIFSGKELGAKRDIILLNAAFALFVDGNVRDIQEAVEIAKSGLDSGKASENLKFMAKISGQLAGSNL
ncbi:MAG: anthranilate phosphoribosyltransferase, partial [Sulfurovum sp.]|nr:anthranilate phosphoribosyltransferase [Sulfurovum sp.]